MDADHLKTLATATVDGSLPFTSIVGKLIDAGVEYYHVDFATARFTFYDGSGPSVDAPLHFGCLPPASANFDLAALQAAILDSQQHGQHFRQFCERALRSGVQGYFVFLRGQRVTYLGRQGDQHVEWFPGNKPKE